MLPLKSQGHGFLRGAPVVLALAASIAGFVATATDASGQTGVPGAPTDVAVYIYSSQQLEVRWSSTDATSTDSFKVQWKSGSQDFVSCRQLTSYPATPTGRDAIEVEVARTISPADGGLTTGRPIVSGMTW